ncbi:MAG: pilus assembly protein TadG-related protein [Acidithiobacillus caldus]|nr:pilus assembly protein TadG-related protein [Acidithiobacillus caldus]
MANSRSNQQRDGARRRWRFLPHRPRGESGQAAIVAVLLIPAAIAGVLLVFNTGQVTANKLKVQNAADAAAYAAMDLQARQMNLDAYLNRAMLTINQALKYPIVVCYTEGHGAGRCA